MKGRIGVLLSAGVVFLSLVLGYLLHISFQPVSDLAQVLPEAKEEDLATDGDPSTDPSGGPAGTSPPPLRLEQAEVTLVDQENRICWQLRISTMEREGTAYALGTVTGEYFTPGGEVLAVEAKKV